jgi:hypothetical protein
MPPAFCHGTRPSCAMQDRSLVGVRSTLNAVGISVWDRKEDAETYARGAYAGSAKLVTRRRRGERRPRQNDRACRCAQQNSAPPCGCHSMGDVTHSRAGSSGEDGFPKGSPWLLSIVPKAAM